MTSTARTDFVRPDESAMHTADVALGRMTHYLHSHHGKRNIRLVVDGDPKNTLEVPLVAIELLARVLAHMAAGQAVSVVPAHAELTTQQAADMLNVSRPYLIKLLDDGVIPHRKVGKHRRVRAEDLLGYKRQGDQKRRAIADELGELDREMGLY